LDAKLFLIVLAIPQGIIIQVEKTGIGGWIKENIDYMIQIKTRPLNDLYAPHNPRHYIRYPCSRRLCLEIQRDVPVPAMNHVAPGPGRRVRRLLGGETDGVI